MSYLPFDLALKDVYNFSLSEVSLILMILITGTFFSGFYPAQILSSFKPIAIFQNRLKQSSGSSGIRRILTIIQFSISSLMS